MDHTALIAYIKATEDNVKPLKVAASIQGVSFFSKLPRSIQNILLRQSEKADTTMSFIVEPYSAFIAYEITDTEAAGALLPPGYRLLPSSMFEGEQERPCAIVGAINLHTSVFWGSRLEHYLIAENLQTGLLSWIIVSYDTNTSSFDPHRGFIGPTTKHCAITTTYKGEVLVDVESAVTTDKVSFSLNLNDAQLTAMKERLWLEGNLSVDYGGDLQGNSEPFGLIFDPDEVEMGYRVSLDQVHIQHNTYGASYLSPQPFEAAYFPFAQHFVTTNFPVASALKNAEDLNREVLKISEAAHRW